MSWAGRCAVRQLVGLSTCHDQVITPRRTFVADKGHEVLNVGSRQAAEGRKGECGVLCDAGLAELSKTGMRAKVMSRSARVQHLLDALGLTLIAAAAHLALATSCVLPWISGTGGT